MKNRWPVIGAALLLGMVASLGLEGENQSTGVGLPTLQTLKQLEYSKAPNNAENDDIGYSEILDLLNACKSYSRAVEILPRFHEPVPTRGDTGILVFRKVSPSVVMVVTANFKDDKVTESGLGTGVIIDPAGYVLTNWHVVHGYDAGIVFLKPTSGTEPDKNAAYGVKLISENEQEDLALLKIVKPPANLMAVKLGELSSIQVAEDIHIIGHPHGQLWSYSTGVISQVRDNYDWQYSDGSKHLARVLQMQTAINPGNSGGPVLDNTASMLGLVAMSEEGQNLNYAVAIDVIKDFLAKAVAAKSRGANSRPAGESGVRYVGATKDGLTVTKTIYSSLVTYRVLDAKNSPIEMYVESSDGMVLAGSGRDAFGVFSEWRVRGSSGMTVLIRSTGNSPGVITSSVGE